FRGSLAGGVAGGYSATARGISLGPGIARSMGSRSGFLSDRLGPVNGGTACRTKFAQSVGLCPARPRTRRELFHAEHCHFYHPRHPLSRIEGTADLGSRAGSGPTYVRTSGGFLRNEDRHHQQGTFRTRLPRPPTSRAGELACHKNI